MRQRESKLAYQEPFVLREKAAPCIMLLNSKVLGIVCCLRIPDMAKENDSVSIHARPVAVVEGRNQGHSSFCGRMNSMFKKSRHAMPKID